MNLQKNLSNKILSGNYRFKNFKSITKVIDTTSAVNNKKQKCTYISKVIEQLFSIARLNMLRSYIYVIMNYILIITPATTLSYSIGLNLL